MENQQIIIEEAEVYSEELLQAVNALGLQLDASFKSLTREILESMLTASDTHLLVAQDGEKIVGMITLCIYRIPFKKKGWLEDLVIDEKYRGRGIGTQLVNRGIELAKENGVGSVNLTSRPTRETANKLYLTLGFEKYDTNVYRLNLQ